MYRHVNRFVRAATQTEDDGDLTDAQIAGVAIALVIVLTLNIVGTVYYVKIVKEKVPVPEGERGWDLASVILGWVMMPLLNISSPISYAIHKQ